MGTVLANRTSLGAVPFHTPLLCPGTCLALCMDIRVAESGVFLRPTGQNVANTRVKPTRMSQNTGPQLDIKERGKLIPRPNTKYSYKYT